MNKKIVEYVKECRDKGFENLTIIEHLRNEYILKDILK